MFHTYAKESEGIYPASAAAALRNIPAKPLLRDHILFYLKQDSQIVPRRRGDMPPCGDECVCVCVGDGNNEVGRR